LASRGSGNIEIAGRVFKINNNPLAQRLKKDAKPLFELIIAVSL
jgi:hypothetical protein